MSIHIKKPIRLFSLALVGVTILLSVGYAFVIGANQHRDNETDAMQVSGTSAGQLAPDFENPTLSGNTIRLSDFRGRVVVLNLFASWCGPCRLETPHLIAAYLDPTVEETAFIGINLNESLDVVAAFQKECDIPYPLVLDEDGKLTSEVYRPTGLPTTWFIDQQGIVRYVYAGAMTQEILLQILADVHAGREPDPFGTL